MLANLASSDGCNPCIVFVYCLDVYKLRVGKIYRCLWLVEGESDDEWEDIEVDSSEEADSCMDTNEESMEQEDDSQVATHLLYSEVQNSKASIVEFLPALVKANKCL